MEHLSIKIPETLYETLEQKAETYQLKVNDIIKECLLEGIARFEDSLPYEKISYFRREWILN